MHIENIGYNERLFSGKGLRNFFHTARYRWVVNVLKGMRYSPKCVVEIGCFDGKLLDYLPKNLERYVGFDAGWEGGLDLAKKRYADNENYQFIRGDSPDGLDFIEADSFDFGVAMETLEHVPPEYVRKYLEKLSRIVNGYIVITVPNEKGFIFLIKWLMKKTFYGGAEPYTFSELIAATLGRMDKVSRNEHKGFDYKKLILDIEQYFDVIKVDGIPFRRAPVSLSFTIGILARSK